MGFISVLKIVMVASSVFLTFASVIPSYDKPKKYASFCKPLIIGHRGASGYVPEHTLGSYALAVTLGADYVEPDLVMTSDGHLVARHENEIGGTTDVADHPEFASRFKTKTVDGDQLTGWFTEDFTLAELKTLRTVERIPEIRPGNARLNTAFTIPTLQEIIDLVKSLQISQHRVIGVYPEIKHSTYFKRLGLPMEQQVVDTLHRNGYHGPEAPVFIQSFEVGNLIQLKNITRLRLIQLLEGDKLLQPFDQSILENGLKYGDMATPEGLKTVSEYASAVGPDKSYIIPRDEENKLTEVTSFVRDAHEAGLKVHPYTFRAENVFLPSEYRSDDPAPNAIGDFRGELQVFLATGIDGLFSDQPDVPFRLREPCY